MADRESAPSIARKRSALALGAGRIATRITDAQCLSIAQQLVILDEATELPPFGMCMAGLQQRLKVRLGLDISESAIKACLSPYYDLAEWEDRYITKSLGAEVEEFGSENHPPRSPLKEFLLSDGEEDDDGSEDGVSRGGSGGGDVVSAGSFTAFLGIDADALGRAGGGGGKDGNYDGGGAGESMQEGADAEDEDEDEDAATGARSNDGEGSGTGSVGGGRARSSGGAGGGAAAPPMPAKAGDAAGSKASSHLTRPTTQRASRTAPSSSAEKVFHNTEKHPQGAGCSPRGAGGGRAIEFDGMEVQ